MSDFFISLGFMKPLLFLKADSVFATIDFFSGAIGVVFNADSVVAFGFAFGTIGGFVAFGFALLTIGGFVGTFGVATALITLSGLGASVFRINHNDHFMIPFSINQPSSFIIC
mgnify:CR=1 FL=1